MLLFTTLMKGQVSFTTDVSRVSERELSLVFKGKIEEGYHLTTDLFFERQEGIRLKGSLKEIRPDVYEQRITLTSSQYSFSGYLEYYACNDEQCLAPESVEFEYKAPHQLPRGGEASISSPSSTSSPSSPPATAFSLFERANSPLWTPIVEELKQLSESPIPLQRSLFEVFLICFLGGLLTILTPCVWPVIPLTVSFFIKRAEAPHHLSSLPAGEGWGEAYSSFAEEEDTASLSSKIWHTLKKYSRLPGVRDAAIYGAAIIVLFMLLGIVVTLLFGVNAMNALSTNAVFNVLCFLLLVIF